MKRLTFLLLLIASFQLSYGQYTRPNTFYGTIQYRLKTDSVLHVPALADTLAHTTDTSAQLRVYQGDLYYKYHHWRKVSGGTAYTAGWGMSLISTAFNADSFSVASRARLYKVVDSLAALIAATPTLQNITDGEGGTSTTSGDIGAAHFIGNTLKLKGSGGTYATLSSTSTSNRAIQLPDAAGTVVLSVNGVAPVAGDVTISTGSGTVTSIATTSPITGGPITGTGTIAINNAAADGSTKGAASFTANDFDASSGNISIDYTNGQAASGSNKGFLTSADWTTFNSKISQSTADGLYFPLAGGTLSGTTNTGFVSFHPQTTAMAAPADGFKLYDSSGFTLLRSDGYRRVLSFTGLSANVKYNFPVGTTNDTVTTNTAPQTLTNKTITGATNIISGIAESSVTNLTSDLAAKINKADSGYYDPAHYLPQGRFVKTRDSVLVVTNAAIALKKNIADSGYGNVSNYATIGRLNNKLDSTVKSVAEQTYSGTITWTGTTAPSGSTSHSYQWEQVGKLVTLRIWLRYGVAGSALTQVNMDLPADCPAPQQPSGTSGTNDALLYFGSGWLLTAATGANATTARGYLSNNSTASGYTIVIVGTSNSFRYATITLNYFIP